MRYHYRLIQNNPKKIVYDSQKEGDLLNDGFTDKHAAEADANYRMVLFDKKNARRGRLKDYSVHYIAVEETLLLTINSEEYEQV